MALEEITLICVLFLVERFLYTFRLGWSLTADAFHRCGLRCYGCHICMWRDFRCPYMTDYHSPLPGVSQLCVLGQEPGQVQMKLLPSSSSGMRVPGFLNSLKLNKFLSGDMVPVAPQILMGELSCVSSQQSCFLSTEGVRLVHASQNGPGF